MTLLIPPSAIIRRELLTVLRRKQSFRNLLLVLLPLMGLWFLFMYIFRLNISPQMMGAAARALFGSYVYVLYGAGLLFASISGATAITGERESDTLESLQLSYITPSAIIVGKIVSAMGMFLIAVIATLPMLGIQFFFTGVDALQVYQTFAVLLSTTLSAALMALACSACMRSTLGAMALTTIIVVLCNGGIFLLMLWLLTPSAVLSTGTTLGKLAPPLAPPLILYTLVTSGHAPLMVLYTVIYQGIWGLVAWCIALRAIRRPQSRTLPLEHTRESHQSRSYRLWLPRLWHPYPLPLPDNTNPIYYKELLESRLAFRPQASLLFLVVFVIVFALSVLITQTSTPYNPDWKIGFLYLTSGLFFFSVPALIATSVAREHTNGNLDALRMTLLSPSSIFFGKLQAAERNLFILFVTLTMGCAPIVIHHLNNPGMPSLILASTATIMVCAYYILAISIVTTSTGRSTATSLVRAYLAALVIFLIGPYSLGVACIFLGTLKIRALTDSVMACSPVLDFLIKINETPGGFLDGGWIWSSLRFLGLSTFLIAIAARRFASHLETASSPEGISS